jgi:hypothetical protein
MSSGPVFFIFFRYAAAPKMMSDPAASIKEKDRQAKN